MHGRPRKPLKPEESADSIDKANKLRALQSQFYQIHHNKIYDKEALDLSAKLLEMNPEIYTAWNYRKLGVESNLQSLSDPDSIKSLLDEELRVVESALRQNYKSYGAWHHRKWVLRKGYSSIEREFRLLDQFLKADSRNFHGWNYRRFVAALQNVSDEEELKFTTDKINANFSNYSAWHNRSVLLSHLLNRKAQGFVPREKVLSEEYELVHQALFTDPDDQSGWFYHLWLLDQTVNQDTTLLISSWPVRGLELTLSNNRTEDVRPSSPFPAFNLDNFVHKEGVPLILYFNQAVEGVNSSTVTVNSMLEKNENLIWKPLSTNKSGKAHSWMTYLKIPDVRNSALKAHTIEVSLGHSQGIISSRGCHCIYPTCFRFTLNLQFDDSENMETEGSTEMINWKDENFVTSDAFLQDFTPTLLRFNQLTINEGHESTISNWHVETLENEIALFRELLSEVNCKIAKLTLARLLMFLDIVMSSGAICKRRTHTKEVLELFNDLVKMDPVHSRYYKDQHSLLLMEQVTSDEESLAKHFWYYKELTSSLSQTNFCLRLNKLSLSRIGFLERLLWIQMLDLSHNELHSIEGLESLQLLIYLNLSHNRISCFTALEPLRLIKSLRSLDISYNEIGMHSIDTTRYLCSSPLSHTRASDCHVEEHATINVEVANYWEALLIFKDMRLTQLDIAGNAVDNENFRMLLVKELPSLLWVDGARVK